MTNMFAKAKAAAKEETPKKGKAKDRPELKMEGLESLASVHAVIKALQAVEATLAAQVKDQMRAHFVESGNGGKARPENFRGQEGDAEASCEIRKRSTASKLTEEEVALFKQHGIDYDTIVSQEETYVINPAYAGDSAMLEKVGAALAKVKGGVPEDFIMFQAEKSANVVSDKTLRQVFELQKAEELIDVVAVLAIKSKLNSDDIKAAMSVASKLIGV